MYQTRHQLRKMINMVMAAALSLALLVLTPAGHILASTGSGTVSASGKATIWVVGDSTLADNVSHTYMKKVGYGTAIGNYFNATVYNLAITSTSSKSYLSTTQYKTLINGSGSVPALGKASGQKYLIIGFGHNDTFTDSARFTDPAGDYKTSGSFAYYLYTYYVKPALNAGVTPVLCTPMVRWTDDNTEEGYNSYYGHILDAGDYPQAIRDLAEAMGDKVILLDLTQASMDLNIQLGEEAKSLYAYTNAEFDQTTCTITPIKIDNTHTNLYGANMNAWQLSQLCEGTSLAAFSKNKSQPTVDEFASGIVDTGYKVPDSTGMFKDTDGIWKYYTNGTFDSSYTGMAKNKWGWWYMKNGKLDLTYTGMAKNQWGWWYMTKGKLNTTYTGLGKNAYGTWYFKKGKIMLSYTGYVRIDGTKYYIKKGKVIR